MHAATLWPLSQRPQERHRTNSSRSSAPLLRTAALRRTLPRCLIEQYARRHGGIQAFHRAGAGNRNRPSAFAARSAGTPFPSFPISSATGPAMSTRSAGCAPCAVVARMRTPAPRNCSGISCSPRSAPASETRFPPMPVPPWDSTRSRCPETQHPIRPKGLRRPQDGPQVSRILDARQHHNQRRRLFSVTE